MADEDERELDGDEEHDVEGGVDGDGKKRLIIIIAGVVVLLLGAGASLYFSGVIGGGDKSAAEQAEGDHGEEAGDHGESKDDHGEKGDGHGEEKGHGAVGDGSFLVVPTMNVSLNPEGGPPRYLRLSVQLELNDPKEASKIEAIMPRVIDKFQTYLRELRVRDLRGSGGIYRLQMELLWRVNQAAAPLEVKDVLFQEILVQ